VRDPRDLAAGDDEASDAERFAAMRPEDRLRVFLELCELTDSIVRARARTEACSQVG
jgi:hypothetical protein